MKNLQQYFVHRRKCYGGMKSVREKRGEVETILFVAAGFLKGLAVPPILLFLLLFLSPPLSPLSLSSPLFFFIRHFYVGLRSVVWRSATPNSKFQLLDGNLNLVRTAIFCQKKLHFNLHLVFASKKYTTVFCTKEIK
jgi:hypothetical protein